MILIVVLLFTSSFSVFMPGVLSAPNASNYEIGKEISPDAVERHIASYFRDIPVMKDIAWCESRFRHYGKNGEVLRGEIVPSDVGVMQINEYFHGKTAEKLGIDLYDLAGNLAYARYLYEKEGTKPWKPSKKCWERRHIAQK